MKKLWSFILAACIALSLVGCRNEMNVDLVACSDDVHAKASVVELTGCVDIIQSNTKGLKYDAEHNSVIIYDLSTDEIVFSTAVDETYYGKEIKNNLTRNAIQQLITIAYTDYNNVSEVVNDLDASCKKVIKEIEDGLRFEFDFEKADIQMAMEITLEEDRLHAKIPAESVVEKGEYGITRIDVLPMLGAVNAQEEGYILFPDGCGALYQFGEYMGVQKTISMDVYDAMNPEIEDEDSSRSNYSNVCLPVFGISLANKGLFANIVSGASDCSLNLASAESAYAVNRIYPSIRVRKQYPIQTASGEEVYAYQKTAYISDFEIVYDFLHEDTGYSAMANLYRTYLTEQGLLVKNEDSMSLAVDFLIGVNQDGMFGGNDVILTTFGDVSSILKDLNETQGFDTKTVLYGWQKGGYGNYPLSDSVTKNAGGKKELAKLCESYETYLLTNYINATAGNKGFSKQSDVVYSNAGTPLTDYKEEYYLLNPITQLDRLSEDLDLISDVNANIALEGVGKTLYEDFNSKKRMTRYGYTEVIKKYFEKSKKNSQLCTDGFMDYFAGYTDYIINLTDDTSNSFLWCQEVPFLQMVLHGSVNYSASLPGNLSSDFAQTKLRWIEYGYVPTFMLTGGRESLLGTDYDLLFTSDYEQWKDTIHEITEEFERELSTVKNEYMVSHTSENQVVTVQYANGVTIVINYNDAPVQVHNTEIPAMDYKVFAED